MFVNQFLKCANSFPSLPSVVPRRRRTALRCARTKGIRLRADEEVTCPKFPCPPHRPPPDKSAAPQSSEKTGYTPCILKECHASSQAWCRLPNLPCRRLPSRQTRHQPNGPWTYPNRLVPNNPTQDRQPAPRQPPPPAVHLAHAPAKSPTMLVRPERLRDSARAWTAVALYRFGDGPATYDGVAYRAGLRTFEGTKIMSNTTATFPTCAPEENGLA